MLLFLRVLHELGACGLPLPALSSQLPPGSRELRLRAVALPRLFSKPGINGFQFLALDSNVSSGFVKLEL